MDIKELAMRVNYSAIPGSINANKIGEYADELFKYCSNNVGELLSLNNNDSYHVGMSFNIITSSMEEPQSTLSGNSTKFKFSLFASLICLIKATQMGTMQSCIAANGIIKLIDRCKTTSLFTVFAPMTGESVSQIVESEPGDILKQIDTICNIIKYYLIQITRAEDAFKDAKMDICNKGRQLLSLLLNELKEKLEGYESFGMLV